MPFGDNPKIYKLALPPGEMPAHGEKLPARLVKNVPTAAPPWWWTEYLTDEWKRKNGMGGMRESRTKWRQDRDRWEADESRRRGLDMLCETRGFPINKIWMSDDA